MTLSLRPWRLRPWSAAAVAAFALGCGGADARPPATVERVGGDAGLPPPAAAAPDPLGPRPPVPAPAAFVPPVPVAYARPNGLRIWLLERHALPIVSIQIVVPVGAASDPKGKGGLALTTANMLDEGAGSRGALAISRDIDRLGATLRTGAYVDYAFASLTTLKKNLAPASQILGDVVSKPTFSPVEWKRVHELWMNALRERASEPQDVARVVALRQVFGDTPYGHPTNGTLKSGARVSLDDVKKFYRATWRPDHATVVVAGDVTRAELDPLLDRALAAWRAPSAPKPDPSVTSTPSATPGGAPTGEGGRRVVVVDRPDAPQSVIAVARLGVTASEPSARHVVRVNTALGGSFTSRLNQDLREEHGWSYGARSHFSFTKQRGIFTAQAAVHTEHTGDALKAMLGDMGAIAKDGLTGEELAKTRLIARGSLVESFESVEAAAGRLARNAGVGLAPDHEPKASLAVDRATPAELAAAAAAYVDPSRSVIVIVGPRAKIEPQLGALGITSIQASGPEGD